MARLCSGRLQAAIASQCICLRWGGMSAALPTRGACFHAVAVVALWAAVGAQQKVLEELTVLLGQKLCQELVLHSETHKAGAKNEQGLWQRAPHKRAWMRLHRSCPALSPPASPAQPSLRQGGVGSSVLNSRSGDTRRSQVPWPSTPPRCESNHSGLGCP